MPADRQLVFRSHAIRRMFQRGIATADIRHTIDTGEVVGPALDDLAENTPEATTIVVTVYEPSPALWRPGFRKRRKP